MPSPFFFAVSIVHIQTRNKTVPPSASSGAPLSNTSLEQTYGARLLPHFLLLFGPFGFQWILWRASFYFTLCNDFGDSVPIGQEPRNLIPVRSNPRTRRRKLQRNRNSNVERVLLFQFLCRFLRLVVVAFSCLAICTMPCYYLFSLRMAVRNPVFVVCSSCASLIAKGSTWMGSIVVVLCTPCPLWVRPNGHSCTSLS